MNSFTVGGKCYRGKRHFWRNAGGSGKAGGCLIRKSSQMQGIKGSAKRACLGDFM